MTKRPNTLTKQPSEGDFYDFDFVNLLPKGQQITGVVNVGHAQVFGDEYGLLEDNTLVVGPPTFQGQRVQVFISGGLASGDKRRPTTHKLTCIVQAGPITKEQDGLLQIRDF